MPGKVIRLAVLGAGGLGKSAARIISMKKELRLVAICDSLGFSYREKGLDTEEILRLGSHQSVGDLSCGRRVRDAIGEIIAISSKIDGVFVALPNLPNTFIPNVTKRFIESRCKLVFTDALKRTGAVRLMFKLDKGLKKTKAVYITGCGATPGLLTAAAVIASQSFIRVEDVNIWWGVGISNWDAYKATIREDIAHMPGYTIEKARRMSDKEVEELLDKTDGRLELHDMEHADDILLKHVGVVDSNNKVHVGGVMDTRSAKKPVSTTMTLTGTTFEGKRSSHKFILGDETSMAANVIGPALGYLKRAIWLKENGLYGIFGSTEFMPMVVK